MESGIETTLQSNPKISPDRSPQRIPTEPASVSIPVQHLRRVHAIRATTFSDPEEISLGQLIDAVAECSASEREVVATVMHMLQTGRVKLARADACAAEATTAKLCG